MPAQDEEESLQALSNPDESLHRPSIDDDHHDHESSKLLPPENDKSETVSRAYAKSKISPIFTLQWPSRRDCTICGILVLALIAILLASGYFVYKVSPPDGQSPPCKHRYNISYWSFHYYLINGMLGGSLFNGALVCLEH